MATLKQIQELTDNQDLVTRVRVATITKAREILADPAKANQHVYFNQVMNNKTGGTWLNNLVWEVVANPTVQMKMIDEPENHSAASIDTDVVYVLTNTTDGVLYKYSVDPNYQAPQ